MRPEWLLTIAESDYHSVRGEYVTAHSLADYRHCPRKFRMLETGELPREDTTDYALGRATHVAILEGQDKFDQEFQVSDGPINPKTQKSFGRDTDTFRRWLAEQTKPSITTSDMALITKMRQSVMEHDRAARLLSDGWPEGTIRCTLAEARAQMRLDWYSDMFGIVDLKTCRDLDRFEFDIRDYGYCYQMALYYAGVMASSGECPDVHLIGVEKQAPYRCGVWRIPEELLDAAKSYNDGAIRALSNSRKYDQWPTGYEEVRKVERL